MSNRLFVAVGLALSSLAALALDLGPMRMESAFNQPLEAYVPVYGDTIRGRGRRLRVTFHDPRNPERQLRTSDVLVLSPLSFEVVRDEGQYYVALRTSSPVREARIDFVLQVSDGRGNTVRRRYLRALPDVYIAGTDGGRVLDRSLTRQAERAGTYFDLGKAGPGDVVSSSDYPNLWTLAMETRAGYGVSVYQTQMAIMEANPAAFGRDGEQISNVNYLLAGHEIRVPSLRRIREYDRASAVVEVAEMNYASGFGPVHERALRSIIRLEPIVRPTAPLAPAALPEVSAPAWAEAPTTAAAPTVAAPRAAPAPVQPDAAVELPAAIPVAPPSVVAPPPPEPEERSPIGFVVGAGAILLVGLFLILMLRRRSDEQVALAGGDSAISDQLDLAQSYLEMRDWDRARSLADSVLQSDEATDEDKAAARELLRQAPEGEGS